MTRRRTGWALLIAANVLCYCVLSFYQTTDAAAPRKVGPGPPFANSVEQRAAMIKTLGDIRELLKEQNALLGSGKLKVVVSEPEER